MEVLIGVVYPTLLGKRPSHAFLPPSTFNRRQASSCRASFSFASLSQHSATSWLALALSNAVAMGAAS
jgi:hypothetical protein